MTGEVTEAIPIPHHEEVPLSHNSYGSAGCNFSYINMNGIEGANQLESTEDTTHEENDLTDTSSRGSATPLPIDLLCGEIVEETADFIECRVVLTNFRLCILSLQDQSIRVISLMSIDCLDFKDPASIGVVCKDGKVYRLIATSNELAIYWHRKLMKLTTRPSVSEAFAWKFADATTTDHPTWLDRDCDRDTCQEEWDLIDYNPDYFKISDDNKDHSLIETYPNRIVVPKWMTKDDLEKVKEHRFLGRIPVVVYVYKDTKAVLLRSSQPKSGFLAWRNAIDEKILQHVNYFTKRCQNPETAKDAKNDLPPPPDSVILDARSYAAAWANRAKGGGFENPDCYGNAKSMFLGLPNIHSVRYAFSQLRTILSADCQDQNTYLHSVSQTQWLQYLGSLINAANQCVDLLQQGTSILVHCSDGWDRTTQIVSLAKLFIDERYRTLKGFELLIRREWIEFGHKFADRNGVYGSDTNERCPVFLQWLDAVWQMFKQNETAFEFNKQYIIKLAQHVYSGLFGTFLFNSVSDAAKDRLNRERRPVSIWQYLGAHNEEIVNQNYDQQGTVGRLANIRTGVQHLEVWKEFYFTELNGNVALETAAVVSSPTLARSAASTPLKEMTSLQKSKSSESINSMDQMQTSTLVAHSESNGALNAIEHHPNETSIMSESQLFRRDAKSRSLRTKRTNVKDWVDYDGMIKFYDPAQEVARRKNKKHNQEITKCQDTIDNLKRDRRESERTSCSERTRDRMMSCDDSELDNMSIDRAYSDMSLLECVDMPSAAGWTVGNENCAICRVSYSKLSCRREDREHHCRKCGQSVCDKCSLNRYHDVHEGKSVYLRACNRCYQQMTACDSAINEEDEEISPGGRPRSRTDTMMRLGGDDSFASLSSGSLTQPVKG